MEAYTLGHGRARSTTQAVTTAFPGPPFPATVQGTTRTPGGAIPIRTGSRRTFTNLQAAAFETGRDGPGPAAELTAELTVATGPGAFTLTLRGDFPAVTAELDGQPVPVTQTSEGIELSLNLAAGSQELVVTP